MLRFSVVRFPGSNCDYDSYYILKLRNHHVEFIWHKDTDLKSPDAVILPGGFSYGDYLRCGIIARFSPIIKEIIRFAGQGGLVIGICNGFQILTECGLLPGTLMMNRDLKFICRHQYVKVCNNQTLFSDKMKEEEVLDFPIAHKEGNFYIDPEGHQKLVDNGQIVFRYCNKDGISNEESNPNGSLDNIAGIINKNGNVLGMMPHPERNAEYLTGEPDGFQHINHNRLENLTGVADGSKLFKSIENCFRSFS